jgi:hypothetical protein
LSHEHFHELLYDIEFLSLGFCEDPASQVMQCEIVIQASSSRILICHYDMSDILEFFALSIETIFHEKLAFQIDLSEDS